jgi:hypothetical protein
MQIYVLLLFTNIFIIYLVAGVVSPCRWEHTLSFILFIMQILLLYLLIYSFIYLLLGGFSPAGENNTLSFMFYLLCRFM